MEKTHTKTHNHYKLINYMSVLYSNIIYASKNK